MPQDYVNKWRFVIVAWDGGGNVPPALAIGRQLRRAGHAVRVLASPSMRARVEAGGLDFRGFRHAPDWGSHLRRGFDAKYILELQCGAGVSQDLEAELAMEPADALVVDSMLFGALAGAERSGIPTAAFFHTLYQVNRQGGPGAIWDEGDLAATNETRQGMGLVPIRRGGSLWDAVGLVLVMVPQAFDRPDSNIPENVHYVGPVLDRVPNRAAWDLPWPADHPDPLVLISFSTTYMAHEEVLQRCVGALARLPVRGLVTVGPSVDPAVLMSPANTAVRSYLDHQPVLPHIALVVTDAGLSTVMSALTHGVPLLCLPMGRDQGANAERVEACGAGRALSRDASIDQVRSALRDLLESPNYRKGAQRMAGIIKREAERSKLVPLIENLIP